ncbi:hypothetical protein YB2330_001121 [Saitoella coloradoensis]
MFTLLLVQQGVPHSKNWVDYLERQRPVKVVNRDQWLSFWEFTREVEEGDDMKGYSEDQAWPTLIDGFVEWVRKKEKEGQK